MKFYILQLLTKKDGTTTPSVYSFDTETDALASWHLKIGEHMANRSNFNSLLCMVVRTDGLVVREEFVDFTV